VQQGINKMNILNLPGDLQNGNAQNGAELSIFNYEVLNSAAKNKINLDKHVISFMVEGQKDVRFADKTVSINATQALLIASGNLLMTEHIGSNCFKCLFFFFPQKKVHDFLLKYYNPADDKTQAMPVHNNSYFRVEKDAYINNFIHSLYQNFALKNALHQHILSLRLEEILLYLIEKYKQPFVAYLKCLLADERELSFKSVIEKNIYSNLSVDEVAFLCNMSLSTFKRKFIDVYQMSPGKWFQKERLKKAREIMIDKKLKASEIYMDFGYNNLSGFSIAFKNEFGVGPKEAGLL
jgi:AraC-like DNA-binding protein